MIVIHMSGGVINGVTCNNPLERVVVIDHDEREEPDLGTGYAPTLWDEGNFGTLDKLSPKDAALVKPFLPTEEEEARRKAIVQLAFDTHQEDGEVEVDDCAVLSEAGQSGETTGNTSPLGFVWKGGDNGCYVQAWVWVSFEGTPFTKDPDDDAFIPEGHHVCPECNGEGEVPCDPSPTSGRKAEDCEKCEGTGHVED